jgi:hypothetical protein
MSFVGGKGGRRQASGYVADDAAFSSGPGAIAAIDGATGRRRRARAIANVASARRDRKLARMTMGAVPLATVAGKVASMFAPRMILPGVAIGSPVRPGTITTPTQKYPGMSTGLPIVRTLIGTQNLGLPTGNPADGGSGGVVAIRPTGNLFNPRPGGPVSSTGGNTITGSTIPGGSPGVITQPNPGAFTTDPSGATCLTPRLLANGYCPPVGIALPPPTTGTTATTGTTTTTTSSGGGGSASGGGGGGGGSGSYGYGGDGSGGPASPPADGGGGPPIDTTELDTSAPPPGTMTAPAPVTPSMMASLTSNKPLMIGLAGLAAWWFFFRK